MRWTSRPPTKKTKKMYRSAQLWLIAGLTGPALLAQQSAPVDTARKTGQPQEVTIVGCLVRTDRSAWRPGTTGSTDPGKSPKSASGLVVKKAATSPEASRHSEREVRLKVEGVDVDEHVGHQVEVKGTFPVGADPTSSASTAPATTSQSGGAGASSSATGTTSTSLPRLSERDNELRVTAIRTLDAACPPRP